MYQGPDCPTCLWQPPTARLEKLPVHPLKIGVRMEGSELTQIFTEQARQVNDIPPGPIIAENLSDEIHRSSCATALLLPDSIS